MSFFPSLDTYAERKRFAVFHAYTAILCPPIVLLVMYFIYLYNRIPDSNPFGAGMSMWFLWSYVAWTILGAWRFMDNLGYYGQKLLMIAFLIVFPFIYLHNIWYLIAKKDLHGDSQD